MPSTTESANDSVGTSTSTVPLLETNTASSSITNLNLTSLEHHNHQQALANNLTNGLMTNHNLSDESIPYLNDKLNNQNNTLINSNNNLTNNLLVTPTEQPSHYTYLKEFRVEQCPLFVQHKCTQHKPFTCFHWHFQNQRRRRPIRKKDGTFNYSPDNYCTKYDETTGICENGDECTLLHRTAGDTERRYHLRYYKTGICVYDTDSRGFCAKNGAHCAFAHGQNDLRNPLYDIHEMTIHNSSLDDQENGNMMNGFSTSLDKDRNALNEDPRWQDTAFVLSNYKTELCKKPPRLCRQGYACPQYHNSKDKRRTPKSFKYRSTPCPSVKQGDEWGDPIHCEAGDNCHYCHTRTEQQFHPEIYKSTKCNDIQNSAFCPRGPFCAFAHNEQEMNAERELSMESAESSMANILGNAFASGGALNTNQTANMNAALDKSILNASTNSNSSQNGISPLNRQQQFNNSNQQLNFQSSSISIAGSNQQQQGNGGAFMPSSVPSHFAFNELAASMGLSHRTQQQPNSGLGGFRRENSPPMLNNNNHNSLGPIARPRSYSSSHTSNLHHNLINRENLINSYLKHAIDEKTAAAMNGLNQQNVLPMRKVSTPGTLFAAGPGQQSFASLSANLVNTNSASHLASSMQNSSANQFYQSLDSTSTTVESVVHSLALDDLTIDDVEESLEKEMLNQNLANQSLHEEQQHNLLHQVAGNPANLVRSSSNLINNNGPSSTQPVNIPGANQRADIGNLNSPMVNFGQSPLATGNVSSSVGSSLYDFASHSGMSPTNQQHHQNAIQNMLQQQNQQAMLVNEIHRLREELTISKSKGIKYEEELIKAKNEVQFWKNEARKNEVKLEEGEMERLNELERMSERMNDRRRNQ